MKNIESHEVREAQNISCGELRNIAIEQGYISSNNAAHVAFESLYAAALKNKFNFKSTNNRDAVNMLDELEAKYPQYFL